MATTSREYGILNDLAHFFFSMGDTDKGDIKKCLENEKNREAIDRLCHIDIDPLSKEQLNQLLIMSHFGSVSEGFFNYYWLDECKEHPYQIRQLPYFGAAELAAEGMIVSHEHLMWGLYRFWVDAMLWFGNVQAAFRKLRLMTFEEIRSFFGNKRFLTDDMKRRHPLLLLKTIDEQDRHLVSEMACELYKKDAKSNSKLKDVLLQSFKELEISGEEPTTIKHLLVGETKEADYTSEQKKLVLAAHKELNTSIDSEEKLLEVYKVLDDKFEEVHKKAIKNTEHYLSMVSDLDVYVATSMRTARNFEEMAKISKEIFNDPKLKDFELRYFDPTLSAAERPEDKGLIECLMVRCAKVLVYIVGESESYGKDAEAAMALSLGKPVIFLCPDHTKRDFYREVHPLTRLVEFDSGVAIGAMIAESPEQVSELLLRIFKNEMKYEVCEEEGYYQLKEQLTQSIVRVLTNDILLVEAFWNHYHSSPKKKQSSQDQ